MIDFQLSGNVPTFVEVKSCSLVSHGIALFPDAVTERGRRHLRELEKAASQGAQAHMVWIIQRPDAVELRPYKEKDPGFAEETIVARRAGVRTLAYKCSFDGRALRLAGRVKVMPDESGFP